MASLNSPDFITDIRKQSQHLSLLKAHHWSCCVWSGNKSMYNFGITYLCAPKTWHMPQPRRILPLIPIQRPFNRKFEAKHFECFAYKLCIGWNVSWLSYTPSCIIVPPMHTQESFSYCMPTGNSSYIYLVQRAANGWKPSTMGNWISVDKAMNYSQSVSHFIFAFISFHCGSITRCHNGGRTNTGIKPLLTRTWKHHGTSANPKLHG